MSFTVLFTCPRTQCVVQYTVMDCTCWRCAVNVTDGKGRNVIDNHTVFSSIINFYLSLLPNFYHNELCLRVFFWAACSRQNFSIVCFKMGDLTPIRPFMPRKTKILEGVINLEHGTKGFAFRQGPIKKNFRPPRPPCPKLNIEAVSPYPSMSYTQAGRLIVVTKNSNVMRLC